MDAAETSITPDSGAEVTVVTSRLLTELKDRGVWLSYQDLPQNAAVAGISKTNTARKDQSEAGFAFLNSRWSVGVTKRGMLGCSLKPTERTR